MKYDQRRYKRHNRIEIMFGRLKDWRRAATRYDRCPKVFLSAIALFATVIYYLWVLIPVCVLDSFSGYTAKHLRTLAPVIT